MIVFKYFLCDGIILFFIKIFVFKLILIYGKEIMIYWFNVSDFDVI